MATLIGPLVCPRLMRSPPSTIVRVGTAPVENRRDDVVELGQRRDHREAAPELGPDRVPAHVPTGVLPEVAHGVVLAHVVGEEPGVIGEHVEDDAERSGTRGRVDR